MSMLELSEIHTYYGNIEALKGVTLKVEEGECVTLIGYNGAGKSTTLRSISGLTPPRSGSSRLAGQPDRAGARRREPGDRAQRRGLPGAVGADQRHALALFHGQRDALQRLDVAVEGVDVGELEQRHCYPCLPR